MSEKISLEEATLRALANEANKIANADTIYNNEKTPNEAEGVIDGIIVVTDPEVDTKDYEEIIDKAQDIVKDTPEGEIPFDEEYLGEYMLTCPICGTTFIESEILEPGATCPICLDQPESFIVVGKVEAADPENIDSEDANIETNINTDQDNVDIKDSELEQTELEKDTASKHITGENILTESIPGMDIFEHQDEYPEINLNLYNTDAQEAIIYIENNINKLNSEQLHELSDKVFMEDIDDVKEFMKYLAGSDDEDIIEIYNEFKKYIPENIEESKDITSKEFEVINATESDIQMLEKGSAFTWEGMATSEDNLQSIVNFFKENTPTVKLPIKFYIWSGKTMNELYNLAGDIAYPDDLSFVSIPLDCWSSLGNLPIIKFQVGARWLDDIVDNNKIHMGNTEDLDECLNKNLVSKKLSESLNIKGLENFDNIANTFKYYSAYEANFQPLIIVKMDKTYYIYKSDAKSYNDYIDYSNSKDYIEGWLHGAVKVKNKVVENSALNENDQDRITQLMNIVDDAFDVKLENKNAKLDSDKLEEDKLEEVVRLTAIPGVTRTPEADFSDDGNRFTTYLYKGVVPISYLKDKYDGDIYLTIAFHHLDDINYDEYKEFDSYKNADDFNGVHESQYDATEFANNLEAAYNDIINFRKSIKPVDDKELNDKIEEINKACKEYKQRVENFIKEHSTDIINLSEIDFKHLKQYIKEAGEDTADYIREASESSKRDFMSTDIESLKRRISNSWQFEYIENMFARAKQESKSIKKEYIEKGFSEDPLEKHVFQDPIDIEEYIKSNGYELLNDEHIDPMASQIEIFDPSGNDGEVYVYDIKENENDWTISFKPMDSYNLNESKILENADDKSGRYIVKAKVWDENQDNFTEETYTIDIDKDHTRFLNYNIKAPMMDKYNIPDEDDYRVEVISYLKENKNLNEKSEWDSEKVENKSWNINGWHLEQEPEGKLWLYNPKGLGGSLIFYPDSQEELTEYQLKNQQVLGFEGNHLPEDIYNKLIDMFAAGEFGFRKSIKESSKLQETGEWDDSDDEMNAWLEDMKLQANELANQINGEVKVVKGFDKYQGPFAVIKTPLHNDIKLWYDSEDDSGLSFICELSNGSFITGGINNIADLLNMENIPDKDIIAENKMLESKSFDKWLDTFISEKGIDLEDIIEISSNDSDHIMEIGYIIDAIKNSSVEEQNKIKNILVTLDFKNAPILPFLKHLGQALADNYDSLNESKITEVRLANYDPNIFKDKDEELKYLYALMDKRQNEMAASYIKNADIKDEKTLEYEMNLALQKDDDYQKIVSRVNELENNK